MSWYLVTTAGPLFPTAQPLFHLSRVQSFMCTDVGFGIFLPSLKYSEKLLSTACASAFGRPRYLRDSSPPTKPSSPPILPSFGETSNVVFAGPTVLTAAPGRPLSRHHGEWKNAST